MNNCFCVKSAVAGIHRIPGFEHEVVTQALLWEKLTVLDQKNHWIFVQQWDGYQGWIHQSYITDCPQFVSDITLTLTDRLTALYVQPNESQAQVMDVPMGVVLPVTGWRSGNAELWMEVQLPDGIRAWLKPGRIPSELSVRERLKLLAVSMLGVPYQWGGKSSLGCDCSGFLQTIFKTCGVELPRDAERQYELLKEFTIPQNSVQPGDLAFFRSSDGYSHIGMMLDSHHIIHSSGFVRISSLDSRQDEYDEPLACSLENFISISSMILETKKSDI